MQVKKIKSFSELIIKKIFEYTFVTFEYEQTVIIEKVTLQPFKASKISEKIRRFSIREKML